MNDSCRGILVQKLLKIKVGWRAGNRLRGDLNRAGKSDNSHPATIRLIKHE